MSDDHDRRYAQINLPHARTVLARDVRHLFECCGLAEEAARLDCGESPNSPLR